MWLPRSRFVHLVGRRDQVRCRRRRHGCVSASHLMGVPLFDITDKYESSSPSDSERHQASLICVEICIFSEMAFRLEHGWSGTRLNEHAGMVATLCQTPLGTSRPRGGGRKSKWSSELWTGRLRDSFSQKSKRGTTSDVYSTLSGDFDFKVTNDCHCIRLILLFLSL